MDKLGHRASSLSDEQRAKIRELKEQGRNYKEIAKELGLNQMKVVWFMASTGLIR